MRLGAVPNRAVPFPYIKEWLTNHIDEGKQMVRRLANAAETAVYGRHVVREDVVGLHIALGLYGIIRKAHYAPPYLFQSLSQPAIRADVRMVDLNQQIGGKVSNRLITTPLPGIDSWAGHRVEKSPDGKGRHVYCTRRHDDKNGRGLIDSIDYYKHPTMGEIVIINHEENLSTPQNPMKRSGFSTSIRFTPDGKTFLVLEEFEGSMRRVNRSSRMAVVVNTQGTKIVGESKMLQENPAYFLS